MTTFKNNAKYAELMMSYLDLALKESNPLQVEEVLRTFSWRFKGGNMKEEALKTRLKPETSGDVFPDGLSSTLADEWPNGENAQALRRILLKRSRSMRRRSTDAHLGTWLMLTSSYGNYLDDITIFSGMRAIYGVFREVWGWTKGRKPPVEWETMGKFTREMALAAGAASMLHVPTCEVLQKEYWQRLSETRVPALLEAVFQVKAILGCINGREAMAKARYMGREERLLWEDKEWSLGFKDIKLQDLGSEVMCIALPLGSRMVRIGQQVMLYNTGEVRLALSTSDVERLHQLMMSAVSCLVGCLSQAVVGTTDQRLYSRRVTEVAEANIERIVTSSARVPLGDEVLVCKGYRRAYTAHLGYLAGSLCKEETEALILEAESTAQPGVLDIRGYLGSLRLLDAAGSLNAGKVFKICPAPDVSPGAAMIDRIKQIGDCNVFDPDMREEFTEELKAQILRAHINGKGTRLEPKGDRPAWYMDYLRGQTESVPSMEIASGLQWEGSLEMPDVSMYDPSNWKDSGLGADTIAESARHSQLGHKKNMLTRLLFDNDCPMPGRQLVSDEHVIKFFVKAEGHKDPARGIFSANLTDRQAQSWMEKAVEKVARNHPSFMIGTSLDERELKVRQLTARPAKLGWVALYYSFDISGWSAKMPAEPQRISHRIWGDLYGGHLFRKATEINEGAHIYLSLDGYEGWYKNTAANLEGFNGKEMTMILVALLSLSVRRWRVKVIDEGILTAEMANDTVALLFAYIDDGLSRIDLPKESALAAFDLYKKCVIETFHKCGFTVETSKCFPSDRFAIFLNEVYLGGRHVVHGVRAAMGISSEPTERHTTLVERVSSVATGVRGAIMAGLSGFSGTLLMAYHTYLHMREWTTNRDAVQLAIWCYIPRAWGGLGMPNIFQMTVSGSGAAFEEGVATMQAYAKINPSARKIFLKLCRSELAPRSASSVLTAPLSGHITEGYMVDSRVAGLVRDALARKMDAGKVSAYAERLLRYADHVGFEGFAEAIVPLGELETIQEQMFANVMEAHPHSIFSSFARRVEKSMTVSAIIGPRAFPKMLTENRIEAQRSMDVLRSRLAERDR